MRKAQIISMDFILTFVIFMFAISIFFFALNDMYYASSPSLDVSSDLLFTKLENVYDESYNFFQGYSFRKGFFHFINSDYNTSKAYELYFQEYENPAFFSSVEYCLFLYNNTGDKKVFLNFPAARQDKIGEYSIRMDSSFKCGDAPFIIFDRLPSCPKGRESILLSRPVLYGNELVSIDVLICAKKRQG